MMFTVVWPINAERTSGEITISFLLISVQKHKRLGTHPLRARHPRDSPGLLSASGVFASPSWPW